MCYVHRWSEGCAAGRLRNEEAVQTRQLLQFATYAQRAIGTLVRHRICQCLVPLSGKANPLWYAAQKGPPLPRYLITS